MGGETMSKADLKAYEVVGAVRGFLNSRSMRTLAETELDLDWWRQQLAKQIEELDAAAEQAKRA